MQDNREPGSRPDRRVTPVRTLEKLARWVKNLPAFRSLRWDAIRRWYGAVTDLLYPGGIEWDLNGTDRIVTLASIRAIAEDHEAEAHRAVLGTIRPGDTVVDVGANLGMYTIPMAKRVGDAGHVIAFEPHESSFRILQKHVHLNGVSGRVRLIQAAVGEEAGSVGFVSDWAYSHIEVGSGTAGANVDCVRLDDVFAESAVAVMKVDTEGFEEKVLRGGSRLLADPERSPRLIYVELHPWTWQRDGLTTTQGGLVALLSSWGYRVETLQGDPAQAAPAVACLVARKATR